MMYACARVSRDGQGAREQVAQLADAGAGFRSPADARADTTTAHGQFADGPWRARGIQAGLDQHPDGRGRGTRRHQGPEDTGRTSKLAPHQRREAIRRRDKGEETLAEIGRNFDVSGWTIARLTV